MLTLALLFLTVTGNEAGPVPPTRYLQKAASKQQFPDSFQHGNDLADVRGFSPRGSSRFAVDLNGGLLQEHISETNRRGALIGTHPGNGFGEMGRRHRLTDEVHDEIPLQKIGGSWMRVEERSFPQRSVGIRQGTEPFMKIPEGFRQETEPSMKIQDGFRQGTEPFMKIPEGFKQGTEPFMKIPEGFKQGTEPSLKIQDGFRQGTEPFMKIPEGFRQGTEPSMKIPDGFRQGTEPSMKIPDGFRQGTEPSMKIPDGFRQGTEPFMKIPDGFRQGTEPIVKIPQGFRQGTEPSILCKGLVISGSCYEFVPTPLAFQDAQALCRNVAPHAELASVPSIDVHSRLVSLVTKGGKKTPVLTWLGGTFKNQQGSWADGSEWSYSDWMPGHPNTQSDKPACIEMFKIDERWWTAADCELKRASICSYPVTE